MQRHDCGDQHDGRRHRSRPFHRHSARLPTVTETATELAQRIREREVSPVEVMDATLRRIEGRNPRLGYKQSWGRVPGILRPNAFGATDPFLFEGVVTRMQIMGRRGADGDVLAASAAFERLRPWDA
jgi:Asp-tRNA(Asn)/Glu-tRNA(Gln) amidotransferase A subunit family amidase